MYSLLFFVIWILRLFLSLLFLGRFCIPDTFERLLLNLLTLPLWFCLINCISCLNWLYVNMVITFLTLLYASNKVINFFIFMFVFILIIFFLDVIHRIFLELHVIVICNVVISINNITSSHLQVLFTFFLVMKDDGVIILRSHRLLFLLL